MTAVAANASSGPSSTAGAVAVSGKGKSNTAECKGSTKVVAAANEFPPEESGFNRLAAADAKVKDETSLAQKEQVDATKDYARIVKENAENEAMGNLISSAFKIGMFFV